MPVLRQYSLPYCTLILEGLTNQPTVTDALGRPTLDILVRFECHLMNQKTALQGGRDLLDGLLAATGDSVQTWLSGVKHRHLKPVNGEAAEVALTQMDQNAFKLVVPQSLLLGSVNSAETSVTESGHLELELPLVQVFDLVEALDQLVADSQTLPGLNWQPAPLSRRQAAAGESVLKQTGSALVGVSSLAAAAALLFMVPVPEVRRPTPSPTPLETPAPTSTPAFPGASPAATPGTLPGTSPR